MVVTCEQIREAISARIDGEPPGTPAEVVDVHVADCRGCAAWQQQALRLVVSTAPAAAPDLVGQVLSTVRADEATRARRRQRALFTRAVLGCIAIGQLVVAVPGLILGHDHTAPIHIAHEVGSFDAALAIGMLLAAVRPRLAAGMLPLVAAITGLLLLTAGSDVAAGRTTAFVEAPHLLDLLGLLLLIRLVANLGGWPGLQLTTPRPTQPAGHG